MISREALIEEVMRWDRMAIVQGLAGARKWIWRVLDALEGRPLDERAAVWLREINQTDVVHAIREELGIDDEPVRARRAG